MKTILPAQRSRVTLRWVLLSYGGVTSAAILVHVADIPFAPVFVALSLTVPPLLLQRGINLFMSPRDVLTGLLVSLCVLVPYTAWMITGGRHFTVPPALTVLHQTVFVAFPEEAFFRGFMQEQTGNTFAGIFVVSALFAIAHIPRAALTGDWPALLSFFPSLVMGGLYWKTGNILPGIVFHVLSNIVHNGFTGQPG